MPIGSTEKLLTSTAALADLGLDYWFHTSVLAPANPTGGVVAGDFYLRGRASAIASETATTLLKR